MSVKVVDFTGSKKDLGDLSNKLREVINNAEYELNMAEVVGVLELLKMELFEELLASLEG